MPHVASKNFRNSGSGIESGSACSEVLRLRRSEQNLGCICESHMMMRVDLDSKSNLVEILFDPEKDIEAS